MDVNDYCTLTPTSVRFEEAGASAFAKGIAGDFNPIHDPGSKRFCVPGDLLFSVLLNRYGVHADTGVRFAGMLDAGVELELPPTLDESLHLADAREREVLTFFGSGPCHDEPEFVAGLSRAYVQFSGATFPDILVELMRAAGVMINPARPLVIYKDMALRVAQAVTAGQASELRLTLTESDLSVTGKKGVARLGFRIDAGDVHVGDGEKNLVLSGLRPFDEEAMGTLVADYEALRRNYGGEPYVVTVAN